MRKLYAITLSFVLSLLFPFTIQAAAQPDIQTAIGYTEDNIRYEVYGTAFVQLTSSSISVSRKVTYDGLYIPSKQIFWKEEINGTSYSGTLTLKRQSYDAELNKTTATYEGILISR